MKNKKSPINVDLAARAEAKLDIRAEVPSTSVGRLVDAFTDIIRPFSEGRGLKADLIRVQREEVATAIARLAQERIAIEQQKIGPVPTKLLLPLLEKGSCEDINDEVMIRRWADLLASASLGLQVQPRLVGVLGELTGNQALLLERIAYNHKQSVNWPYGSFADSPRNFA